MKKTIQILMVLLLSIASPSLFAQELKKIETFYKDGKVKEQYFVDSKGLKQGMYVLFYENGNKKMEIAFRNGVKEGRSTSWHSNGKVNEEGYFRGNKRSGKYIAYDEMGNVIEKKDYK